MKALFFFLVISFVLWPVSKALAAKQIIVVTNMEKPPPMKKHEIRNLFMGGASNVFEPVVLKPGEEARHVFNTLVVGLTEARIQSYWAQMRFSGRHRAPVEVESTEQMLQYLLEHKGAVGYLPADVTIPEQLTVLFSSRQQG
ncbi:hypothetical protein [Aestuariibacter sp. A3R04]|uniref:hypothetical protein n=1 Tax=Aestuariibacter sp. A3R04 TaxID=2841571 RepID=UPI001C08FB77|nr:hypothetical protein [Aestuariibacter sp. A3R04]MBU3021208.1 hypothetical protein [Aestuariibacter sp. A3R04]